jgi:hypothetical protein
VKYMRLAGAALLVGSAWGGCGQPGRIGSVPPEIKLTDLTGKPVALSEQKGQVVLIGFWAVG